jgi:hypothetical protein
MMSAVLNRTVKVKAPEPAVPTGKLSRADFLKQFPEVRAKTIKLVMENDQALKEHTFNHPNLGPMNGYHWLLLIPLHNMRHNLQIVEVKATEGFPKSKAAANRCGTTEHTRAAERWHLPEGRAANCGSSLS